MADEPDKLALIEEARKRIEGLAVTDQVSDVEKIAIARKALQIIENGKSEEGIEK